jgi:PAS domain S-box-containing protein
MPKIGSPESERLEVREFPAEAGPVKAQSFDTTFAAEYSFSPVPQVTLDQAGRICWLNFAAAHLLRSEQSQLYNLPFLAFIEKSYFRRFLDHLDACVNQRQKVSTDLVLATYTRASAPIELRSVPGADPASGRLLCRTAIIEQPTRTLPDYTELFDFFPDAIIVHIDGKIVNANSGAAKLLRASSPSELVGLDFLSIVHQQSRVLVQDRLERFRRGEKELPVVEEQFLRRDGTSVSVNVMSRSTVFNGKTAVLVLARDVSNRVEMETNLGLAEDLAAQILDSNSVATAVISLRTERFLAANEVFCSLAGLVRQEIVGRSLGEVGWRLMSDGQEGVLKLIGMNDVVRNAEARLRRPDGGSIDVMASVKTISYGGERAALLMLQDLTDLQLLRKEVVDISEEEQRRFGRDLHDSHCQDLTAISFFAENIASDLEAKDPETAAQLHTLANMISKSAENVHAIAASLGLQQLEEIGLEMALRGMADRFGRQFQLTCQVTVDESCKALDVNQATHLYRIAQEATSNAARHGQAKTVDIKLTANGRTRRLEVRDDGTGFSVEETAAGLGLRTMKYRAAVIQGTLHVASRPGTGTTVTCLLPRSVAD